MEWKIGSIHLCSRAQLLLHQEKLLLLNLLKLPRENRSDGKTHGSQLADLALFSYPTSAGLQLKHFKVDLFSAIPTNIFTSTLSASQGKHNRGFGTLKNVGSSCTTLEPAWQPEYSCLLFSGRRRRAVAQWFNFNINQSRRARKQLPLHQQ